MNIEHFFHRLDSMFAQGQVAQVDGFLRSNLEQAEQEKDIGAVIAILNEMSGYYRSTSQFDAGLRASEYSLRELEKVGKSDTIDYATALLNMAGIYRAAGKDDKALEIYRSVESIYREKLSDKDYRMASLYNNMSGVCRAQGDLQRAKALLRSALEIISANDDNQAEAATTHINLGLILLAQDNCREAAESIYAAFALLEKNKVKGIDPHFAAAYSALGELYFRQKRYRQAAEAYEKALALIGQLFGETLDYAAVCGSCAACYDKLGLPEQVERYKGKETEIRKKKQLSTSEVYS